MDIHLLKAFLYFATQENKEIKGKKYTFGF